MRMMIPRITTKPMSAATNKVVAQGFPVVPEMGRQLAQRIGPWTVKFPEPGTDTHPGKARGPDQWIGQGLCRVSTHESG